MTVRGGKVETLRRIIVEALSLAAAVTLLVSVLARTWLSSAVAAVASLLLFLVTQHAVHRRLPLWIGILATTILGFTLVFPVFCTYVGGETSRCFSVAQVPMGDMRITNAAGIAASVGAGVVLFVATRAVARLNDHYRKRRLSGR